MTTTNGYGISFGRFWAMTIKEFIQMTRDRITLATMVALPIMQLFLFGFAINTTPHNLPTAVLMRENTDVGRSILAALANTDFFEIRSVVTRAEDMDSLLESGKVLFVVEIPRDLNAHFAAVIRLHCWSPPMRPIPSRQARLWVRFQAS